MKSIRRSVFETNSSSTHSITMCSKEDFDAWKKGKVVFEDTYNGGKFITLEKAMKKIKENDPELDLADEIAVEDALREESFRTYESYFEDDELECFTDKFKTKGGEEVIAFGKYGYQ